MRQPLRAWGDYDMPYPPPRGPAFGDNFDMPYSAKDRALRRNSAVLFRGERWGNDRMMMDDGWCGPEDCW